MADNPRSYTNRSRAESFGANAEAYDRFRPRYPGALFDRLLTPCGPAAVRHAEETPAARPQVSGAGLRVLDVGTGTGIVARELQARGADVLGLEIDDRMAAVARASGVEVETAAFESWDPSAREFDLITCGQAWHWIDPVTGPVQGARLLAPGGRLAPFWNYAALDADQVNLMQPVYAALAPQLAESVVLGRPRSDLDRYAEDIERSAQFEAIDRYEFAWRQRYSRDEWLAMLGTHSDHLALAPDVRAQLMPALGRAIDGVGGELDLGYVTTVLVARKP